jgi:hypothetical protein
MTLQAVDDLRAVARNLDKPATARSRQATLAPTELRQIIQRRRDAISASESFKEWVATVEPGAKVPQQGVTFWHLMGANKTTAQLLPDTFATGLSTQVIEGSNRATLTL